MLRISRRGWFGFVLATLIIVVDQIVKAWILGGAHLLEGDSRDLFGPISLTMVWNPGVAYGLFRGGADWMRWVLCAFELVVSLVLAGWLGKAERAWTAVGVGLVLGGAIGNLVDRTRFGAVVDFIDVRRLPLPLGWHFPWVFNVADGAITLGIIALLAESLFAPRPVQK